MPHARQRPRSARNDSTGMLSYHFSSALQPGQAEPGRTRLRPAGTRATTTLRKLPMESPKRATATRIPVGHSSATAPSCATITRSGETRARACLLSWCRTSRGSPTLSGRRANFPVRGRRGRARPRPSARRTSARWPDGRSSTPPGILGARRARTRIDVSKDVFGFGFDSALPRNIERFVRTLRGEQGRAPCW